MFRLTKNYWGVLSVQVFLIIISGFIENHPSLYVLFVVALIGIFGSISRKILQKGWLYNLSVVCAIIAVATGFAWVVPGITEENLYHAFTVCTLAYAGFILIAVISMSRSVFITDKVTTDRIVGSICIYLLIGMFFAFVYTAMSLLMPDAFDLRGMTANRVEDFRDYIYFSYTTLTTIGYGDMVPTNPYTRMTAVLEGIAGTLYVVIMIARLVGMHISQAVHKQ